MKRLLLLSFAFLLLLPLSAGVFSSYDFTFYKTADKSMMEFSKQAVGLDYTGYGYLGSSSMKGLYLRLGVQTPYDNLLNTLLDLREEFLRRSILYNPASDDGEEDKQAAADKINQASSSLSSQLGGGSSSSATNTETETPEGNMPSIEGPDIFPGQSGMNDVFPSDSVPGETTGSSGTDITGPSFGDTDPIPENNTGNSSSILGDDVPGSSILGEDTPSFDIPTINEDIFPDNSPSTGGNMEGSTIDENIIGSSPIMGGDSTGTSDIIGGDLPDPTPSFGGETEIQPSLPGMGDDTQSTFPPVIEGQEDSILSGNTGTENNPMEGTGDIVIPGALSPSTEGMGDMNPEGTPGGPSFPENPASEDNSTSELPPDNTKGETEGTQNEEEADTILQIPDSDKKDDADSETETEASQDSIMSQWSFSFTLGPAYRSFMGENAIVYFGTGISNKIHLVHELLPNTEITKSTFANTVGIDLDFGLRLDIQRSTSLRIGTHFTADVFGWESVTVKDKGNHIVDSGLTVYGYAFVGDSIFSTLDSVWYLRLAKTFRNRKTQKYYYYNVTPVIGNGIIREMN